MSQWHKGWACQCDLLNLDSMCAQSRPSRFGGRKAALCKKGTYDKKKTSATGGGNGRIRERRERINRVKRAGREEGRGERRDAQRRRGKKDECDRWKDKTMMKTYVKGVKNAKTSCTAAVGPKYKGGSVRSLYTFCSVNLKKKEKKE